MTELDNLHNDADGKKDSELNPENQIENTGAEAEKTEVEETTPTEETAPETESVQESETAEAEAKAEEAEVEEEPEIVDSQQEKIEETPEIEEPVAKKTEETQEEEADFENDEDLEADESEEESEEDTEAEAEDEIPFKNYDELPLNVLIGEAKDLLSKHPARKLREHFNQIRTAVIEKLDEDKAAKLEAFLEEGGEEIDFQYMNPSRREFNQVYNDYRKQIKTFRQEQEKAQNENLEVRLQLIEELKALYLEPNEDNVDIFKKYREIKTRWHNAGFVPRAKAGNVFRTYFHHLDNFYKYLDLNKELREMDYAHNLETRESIIKRATKLVEESNVQKALNELQYLHRLWKEEAVPVAEEHREPTWQKFKELTQKIHDRKAELNDKIKEEQEENLKKKQDVLSRIAGLTENAQSKKHGDWQSGIRKLKGLRDEFLAAGRVPREHNQKLWNEFKRLSRDFNHQKNEFYKNLKNEQQENLEKKRELLRIAKEHSESKDWNNSVQVVKRIQSDWKRIGHVPRKFSDSIWKEFKEACNKFFDAYKNRNEEANEVYEKNYEEKLKVFDELKAFKPGDNVQENLDVINEFNIRWNSLGKVPASKMSINNDFNKKVRELIKAQGLSEREVRDFRMDALLGQIKSDHDEKRLDDEIRRSRKLVDDLEKEITQLETNIGFFANADKNNPLLKSVFEEIEEKRRRLTDAEVKLRKLLRLDLDEEPEEEVKAESDKPAEAAETQPEQSEEETGEEAEEPKE